MSYRKYINDGKEPNKFVKGMAKAGATVASASAKAFDVVGDIGEGILKYTGEAVDVVFSTVTLPLRGITKVLFYLFQEGEKPGTRVAAGIGALTVAIPTGIILLPGMCVYALLKSGAKAFKRVTNGFAYSCRDLKNAILIEGDPKGYFDSMKEKEQMIDQQDEEELIQLI